MLVAGINTTGIQTGSSIVLLNGIFQKPTTANNSGNNYGFNAPSASATDIVFTGITSANGSKIISQSDIKVNSNVDSKINKKPVKVDNIKPEAKENLASNANNLFDESSDDKIESSSKKEDKNFKIQLGAFSSLENAKEFISQINNQNFNNDSLVVENDRKVNLYRIHSSKSFSKENAKKVCEKFINNSYNCILFKI